MQSGSPSSWQVMQRDLASACVRTTFPSLAGAWQTSHCLSAKGGCMNLAINLGASDWCGSWHCTQSATDGLILVRFL